MGQSYTPRGYLDLYGEQPGTGAGAIALLPSMKKGLWRHPALPPRDRSCYTPVAQPRSTSRWMLALQALDPSLGAGNVVVPVTRR